ncbi:hypothetical protein ACFQH9_00365 [Pseudonocardia lutea]|uniref:Uncharacterized protein n=1 Tax=Pseudonocardia lutea TaxID=2172015 RepID=A0ABW1I2Y8_9PSEU
MSETPHAFSRRALGTHALFAVGGLAVGAAATSVAVTGAADAAPSSLPVRRSFTEYRLPEATQTHEIAWIGGSRLALVTQMSDSTLIKLWLDRDSERVTDERAFTVGSPTSELHGLAPSRAYPGLVWATLQRDNKILLLDPQVDDVGKEPTVVRSIDVPAPGFGPHQVNEIGDHVWAGLKYPSPQTGKFYVLAVNHTDPADRTLYECLPQPVFEAQEPASGLIYASQDASSSIMQIEPASGRTRQIPVPPEVGQNPVGLVRCEGRLEGVWVTLAGSDTASTGAFGRIRADGRPVWFRLSSHLGRGAALLHLADATTPDGPPALWLLSTSLLNVNSPDALIHVTFNDDVTAVVNEEFVALPTQTAKAHRVLPLTKTVLVSEWNSSTVAQLEYTAATSGSWDKGLPAAAGTGHVH